MFNFGVNLKEVDAFDLHRRISEGNDTFKLIDVRTPAEVAQGKIPGAEHIPLNLLPMKLAELPDDQPVIFYCRTGARSAQACAFVAAQGKDNTYNLSGGIVSWVRNGLAVA